MLFVLLCIISLLLGLAQSRGRWARDLAPARSALLFGGTAYLAGWLLQVGVGQLAFSSFGRTLSLPGLVAVQGVLSALLGLALWSALYRLALQGSSRRDLLWVIPFLTLSILVGARSQVMPLTAALLAAPALSRNRWRREITPGTQGLVSIFGVLFALLLLVSLRFPGAASTYWPALSGLERYADWVRGLAVVHVLISLPRLLWGMNLPVKSVKRRLLVSHLLTGLVPLALVLIFWGLSTYLSVTAERAQIAARELGREAAQLGGRLETALSSPSSARSNLQAWARLESRRLPGIRIWLGGPDSALTRIAGEPLPGETALAQWPDSLDPDGVIMLEGRAYLGAVRRARGESSGSFFGAIVVPATSFLGGGFRETLNAETYLETRWVVAAGPELFHTAPAARDSAGAPGAPAPAVEEGAFPGAAMIRAVEWSGRAWQERRTLLWARVGFADALRGVARNVRENPANLFALVFLAVVALLFVLVEVMTLGMVVSMGRSILRALSALRQGTSRLRSGNFRYRIPLEGDDELWNVAESFNEMAADLDKARELEIEKERLEGELSLARQIQARLLPADAPVVPRLELAGLSYPAREVGGDYYDFLPLTGNRLGLIVADVSGKGVGAALLMSSFRAALLSQDLDAQGPAATLARLNAFLHRSVEPGRFVTAFLGVLDPATGRLLYANAGHNPPIWVRRSGELSLLREGGLILGFLKDASYDEARVQLAEADLIALYTDGVTETTNEDEEFWGEERFFDCLRRRRVSSCREILREILHEVRAFAGGGSQADDLTLLLARWRGES